MNAIENYKSLIKKIFDRDIDVTDNPNTNNCIGALNNPDNYEIFTNNFIERLQRIYNFFKNDISAIENITNTLKSIAITKGYKWSGSYSEIVALDYWIQYENLEEFKYVDRGDVNSFEDSIAKQIGQDEIDLDISFNLSFTKIFMDVKSLIPTHLELVDQILNRLQKKNNRNDYLIGIDDLFTVDYLETKKDYVYELSQGTLIEELDNCINNKDTYYTHTLQSGRNAKFRIAYSSSAQNTVLTTMRSMDPYRLALDYQYKVLDYYNKLLIDKPSFLTFVSNPWFNNEMSDFSGFNDIFYRSLARRTFINLVRNNDDMGLYYPELIGKGLKISDVINKISGLIFIDDHSIMNSGKDLYNVRIYTNPNATNKVLGRYDFDILRWSHFAKHSTFVEDFKYDNY